jgi:hypothetical protein
MRGMATAFFICAACKTKPTPRPQAWDPRTQCLQYLVERAHRSRRAQRRHRCASGTKHSTSIPLKRHAIATRTTRLRAAAQHTPHGPVSNALQCPKKRRNSYVIPQKVPCSRARFHGLYHTHGDRLPAYLRPEGRPKPGGEGVKTSSSCGPVRTTCRIVSPREYAVREECSRSYR